MTDRQVLLKELIDAGDLQQTDIAELAGCSQVYVSLQASGDRPVTDPVLEAAEELCRRKTVAKTAVAGYSPTRRDDTFKQVRKTLQILTKDYLVVEVWDDECGWLPLEEFEGETLAPDQQMRMQTRQMTVGWKADPPEVGITQGKDSETAEGVKTTL